MATSASSPTLRRLMKEAQELSVASPSPSPYFFAHPVSDSDFFDWHFTLAGPPAPSPYADGIYHGRIVLPRQYPLRPPSFRFLTPSGRFEVNREICLSISGHHEETWQPAWGIRTALTALRSFMDGDAKGQLGGVEAREEVRREWAKRSRKWKCDVCSGGKTNEELLAEWREVCKTKGVKVDEEEGSNEGKDSVPDGLRFGYKDEHGKVQDISQEQDVQKAPAAPLPQTHVSAPIPSPPSEPSPAAPRPGSAPVPNTPSPASSSSRPSPSTNPTSSTASRPSRPAGNPTPSAIQPTRTVPQPRRLRAPNAAHAVHDTTAWMDRAISVVGISLIIMVLKKWIVPYLL